MFLDRHRRLYDPFAPANAKLLATRYDLQAKIDACHEARAGQPIDQAEYQAFLRDIAYLVPEPAPFAVHGVATPEEAESALRRMAAKVDAQNAGDPLYKPISGSEEESLAFQAAQALTFKGSTQPNGYTEPLLHPFRQIEKKGVDRRAWAPEHVVRAEGRWIGALA